MSGIVHKRTWICENVMLILQVHAIPSAQGSGEQPRSVRSRCRSRASEARATRLDAVLDPQQLLAFSAETVQWASLVTVESTLRSIIMALTDVQTERCPIHCSQHQRRQARRDLGHLAEARRWFGGSAGSSKNGRRPRDDNGLLKQISLDYPSVSQKVY